VIRDSSFVIRDCQTAVRQPRIGRDVRLRSILSIALVLALLLGIISVALLVTRTSRQEADLAALNKALGDQFMMMESCTPRLPPIIKSAIWRWLTKDDPFAAPDWRWKFAAYLEGPVESISISGHGPLGEDVPEALARFSNLQRLDLTQDGSHKDQAPFCAIARRLPKLETLEIISHEIDPNSLEPLRGHPTLKRLILDVRSGFSPRCLEPLRTLPALRELTLGAITGDPMIVSPEDKRAITEMLPTVTVVFE
jgi:hypothetical protein